MSLPTYKRVRPIGTVAEETVVKGDKDALFWSHFRRRHAYSQSGPVSACSFSPSNPRELLVAASLRVTKRFGDDFSQEKNMFVTEGGVCSLSYRPDGCLLAVGTASGKVLIIESSTRSILRELIGHVGPVRAVSFLSGQHVASVGDDQNTCLWEVSDGSLRWKYNAHTDFVRALATNPEIPDLFGTGSYDGKVAIWKVGVPHPLSILDHGSPVEAITFLSDHRLVSTGEKTIKIWDWKDGTLERELRLHHKTITSVTTSHDMQFLISSSLDRSVKIIRLCDWRLMASYKVESAVLSVSLDKAMHTIAIGTTSGTVSILSRKTLHLGSAKGVSHDIGKLIQRRTNEIEEVLSYSVPERQELQQFDRLLKSFRYRMALDTVIARKNPELLVQAVRELTRREGLQVAISGRSDTEVSEIIDLVVQGLPFPHMASSLLELAFALLEIYGLQASSSTYFSSLRRLKSCITHRVRTMDQMLELEGQLALVRRDHAY